MSDAIIRVENLGKQYHIGAMQAVHRYKTFRDALSNIAHAPVNLVKSAAGGRPSDLRNDTIWALKDVSFEVKQGEVIGIIGRNGAGKSTLLKVLTRITEPTEGLVEIHGRVGSLLEVGTGFHPELTGRENIYLNGAILGMTRQEINRKFDEIVEFSGVEKFIDTPVKHYSSGMQVRLAFSVAAHLEPDILLVDEVLAVGDVEFQKKCLGKMEDVATAGQTVLIVSHIMGLINDLCARTILLKSGLVIADGLSGDVIQQYLSSGGQRQAHIEFAPTAKEAHFNTLTLYCDSGEPSTSFDIRKPIFLRMQFSVKQRIPGLQASIALFNSRGYQIFYHSSGYVNPPIEIENAGDYDLSVRVPGSFLPKGSYSINVALHIPDVALFERHEYVLTFDVDDTGSKRYDYDSHALGCVLVDLEWEKHSHRG